MRVNRLGMVVETEWEKRELGPLIDENIRLVRKVNKLTAALQRVESLEQENTRLQRLVTDYGIPTLPRVCLNCGAEEPCKLDKEETAGMEPGKWPGSPCTFDRSYPELIEWVKREREEVARLRSALEQSARLSGYLVYVYDEFGKDWYVLPGNWPRVVSDFQNALRDVGLSISPRYWVKPSRSLPEMEEIDAAIVADVMAALKPETREVQNGS